MYPPPETSRLCRLIDEFLRPLTFILEESDLRINKKSEQQLLISLSQVFKQIQLWTNELDTDSDNVMEVKVPDSNGRSSSESKCCCGDHDCLTKIVGDMMLLLSVGSRYAQHLAGNILVAISNYLVVSESNWAQFVKSLYICLELAISNALLCSLDRPQCSDHVVSHAIIALQPKLKRATWSSMACVVRVLRTILKRIKQDIDEELLQSYMDLTSSSLGNVPWDVMDENWKAIRISSDSLEGKDGQLELSVFHATLVQLFCSLVNPSDCDGAAKSFNEHPVICQISYLVPTLLGWCLGRGNQNNMYMFEYFRHKILMLMIRFSSKINSEDSLLILWLNLIHEYFEDLLLLPMTQPDQEDTLADSPFIPSIGDAKKRKGTSSHLQRLVVLLFLRCSFGLAGFADKSAKHGGIHSDLECSYIKKGLSELQWWLQIHLSLEMLGASECYFERCTSFSISFLRLFIHEDDILFELLLLLFCVPFYTKQKIGQDMCAFQEMNDDILFHVSNILNPIQLFHIFLSELHYDHQVLLDYLISKDTGAPSAEYLLRSLRIVCDSWTKFVEFSLKGEATNKAERSESSGKKRKVLADGSDFRAPVGSLTEKGDSVPSSPGKNHQEAILTCNVYSTTYGLTFEKAKGCLLLLKKTVHNLHQKELFPYNPKVLLCRLERFQELSLQH